MIQHNYYADGGLPVMSSHPSDQISPECSSQVARRILTTGQPAYQRAFMKLITSTWNGTTPGSDPSREEKRAVQAVQFVRAMATGVGA
jgi:hypothetical protein